MTNDMEAFLLLCVCGGAAYYFILGGESHSMRSKHHKLKL